MVIAVVQKIMDTIGNVGGNAAVYTAVAAIAAVVLLLVWKVLGGRKKVVHDRPTELTVDVGSLGSAGPPPGSPVLEFYYEPVRLAAVIVAPAGRGHELPPINQLDAVFEAILPGLSQVVAAHKSLVRRWPAQLSVTGFALTFFKYVRLPGDAGKGTPWSSVAGVAKLKGHSVMAGLVLRTELPTNHGQVTIDSEEKWLGILRVKS
ncbi:MAG: hypothetical protein HQ567_30070 [Candidatus Nealsonbacteria bacterium]|nr:hypothetical protein [Candidatus Nealsonbacteria bacterium]